MSDNANDIAIVGVALRVPGAKNAREYWKNLVGGVESIRTLSTEELIAAGEDPEEIHKPGYVPRAGLLDGMEMFDGEFFGFGPKESAILDPQHRHFMECAWEALEDAGHVPTSFDGRIGVFGGVGMGSYFYWNVCSNRDLVDSVGLFLLRHTGNDKDFLATRVSYVLNLQGPSINVQTACSTSLVATHLACQSLLSGECDMAVAGGVTINIPHVRGYMFHEGEILSPDGHCHAFDHRAQGTVLTSGAALVTLRRLSDALADNDHIYAVIKGSAVNNDGAQKVGYLAPSVDGQAAAMIEAYGVAGIEPESIGYIECHGTGTYMGDPIEVTALTQAFRQSTQRKGFCRIGSVKSAIGHLDTAAGTAGLIKAALSVEHGKIPATLNFEKPNPTVDFESSPFVVNSSLYDWKANGPRRAAINSLGVGGTNAHAVIEQPPARKPASASKRPFSLISLSARNQKALDGASQRLAQHFLEHADVSLPDAAYTLHVGRRAFDRRRVVVASTREEAAQLLQQGDQRRVFTHTAVSGKASVAFMFSGGGTQYARMCADLYESEPVFRAEVDRALNHLKSKHNIDLKPLLFAPKEDLAAASKAFEPMSLQLPGIAIIDYALAKLWMSWGVEPTALIGHSMGENVAACIAGVLKLEDLIDLVKLRGELMDRTAKGGMLSVPLPPEELRPLLNGETEIGTVNAPRLCVASGAAEAIDALEQRLTARGIDTRRLALPAAAHSRLFDPILDEFHALLKTMQLSAPKIPIVSNRTGTWLKPEDATNPDYWRRHLRETVLFADGIATLLEEPNRVLIEVGPGQALCSFARQHPKASQTTNIIPSVRHKDDTISDAAYFVAGLGRLWASGAQLDLSKLWEGETRHRISLPTYAFAHQRYFIERVKPTVESEDLSRLKRLPSIDEWGFKPVWLERSPKQRTLATPEGGRETWLVFMDDAGVGTRLVKRLRAQGHTVVTVNEGDAYVKKSDTEYALSPERGRSGYDALVRDLMASGRAPTQIVHLWLATTVERFRPGSSFFHRNLEHGFYSVFFLAQALGDENVPRPLHITVVSTGMQQVRDEALLYPEKITVLGPVKVMPRELPGVTCSCIDVDLAAVATETPILQELLTTVMRTGLEKLNGKQAKVISPIDVVAELLERDLIGEPGNHLVAYRDGRRYVQEYQRHLLAATANQAPAPLRDHGVYMITGGLGGIGITIAEALAKRVKARLVLLARTELPPKAEWDAWLTRRGPTDRSSRAILRVRELEALGAEVMVAAADVTNLEQMQQVVAAVKQRFGGLNGVVHTAGVVRDNLIQLKTELDVQDVFAPKVHGTVVLDTVFKDAQGLDFMVLFSSTSALAAPPGQVDYVAANAFLDAFARVRGRTQRTVAVNWGIWNGVGMAAEALDTGSGQGTRMEKLGKAAHPAFAERLRDERGRTIIEGTWRTGEQWMLEEHRTGAGHALIPGTGYLELARAALEANGEPAAFEIRDLFFIRPLHVPDEGQKDVRVRIQRTDEGYAFDVRSKSELDGRPGWELHAQARLVMEAMQRPAAVDLAAIDARCTDKRVPYNADGIPSAQEAHLRFGPRWRVLRQVAYGKHESIATLELANIFKADLEHYGLHPALMDISTGYAMQLIEGYKQEEVWVPVNYGSVRVYGRLPGSVRSWVRGRPTNTATSDFAVFDITITDDQGVPVVEVKDFSIKRMGIQTDFAVSSRPTRADIELEPGMGSDAQELSPAEQQLRRNYEMGIRADEGGEALVRVLAGEALPQIAITSLDINQLVRQVESVASASSAASSGQKFDRPELDSAYVAPRDEIERTLAGFWEELLGVDQVGVQDSFFELGGHSLIAVRLFAMVKKAYQVEFAISVLFEAPTIERCANMIRDMIGDRLGDGAGATNGKPSMASKAAQPRARFRHLVAMHPGEGGPRTPMFLVAGMFGNVLNLRHLAHLVGTDRPFYGIQALGLYGDEKPHETFEEMAQAYIAEMRIVQPHGPYFIGGFSGGGITAFEIAHQLKAQGEEIALLVLLDTPTPMEKPVTAADRARIQIQRLQAKGPAYIAEWARNRATWEIKQLQKRLEDPEPVEHTPDQFQNDAIERAFRSALPRYQMRHLKGRIVLFRPKLEKAYVMGSGRYLTSGRKWVYEDNGWGEWCDEVEVHEVPGDHDAMVLEPAVRVMAKQFRQAIEDAEGRRSFVPPPPVMSTNA
jgi:acyl transferase domain-containing protein/thioesterase domain-containing protein/acyl carrier protein